MVAVPVRSRRQLKGLFLQKLQHAVPSIVVFGDGIDHLTHDPHGASLGLGVAEVGVSALVIGSVILGFRRLRSQMASGGEPAHPHRGVDWVDLCLAAMLAVEAVAKYQANGHIARPTIVLAVFMVGIGLGHGRLARWGDRRRELRVDDDGISIPGRFFRRHTVKWTDLASIEMDDRAAVIASARGETHRLNLTDVMQPAAIREALAHARMLHERALAAAPAADA